MHLTKSEMEIMEVLWRPSKPMCRREILSAPHTYNDSSIHILINSMLKKKAILTAGFKKAKKTYARTFVHAMSQEKYWAQLIYNGGKKPRLCESPDVFPLFLEIIEYSGLENNQVKAILKAIYDGIN